ncbi:MAG: hypothetical protein V8R24_03370 [Dorea longicatena]
MQHTQQLFLEALKAALKNEQVEWNNKLRSAGMDGPVPHGGSAPDPSDDL